MLTSYQLQIICRFGSMWRSISCYAIWVGYLLNRYFRDFGFYTCCTILCDELQDCLVFKFIHLSQYANEIVNLCPFT
ncbi:hypothetical protein Lal_00021272, partial [Lupinus albus]